MLDEQKFFLDLVSLTGKPVEVGVTSLGRTLQGRVINAMFDSFLLDTAQGTKVIRFDDILFLEPQLT